jgi:methyl-accepting chemotaxis protein
MTPGEAKPYVQRAVRAQQIAVASTLPPLLYLISLFLELEAKDIGRMLWVLLPLAVVFGVARWRFTANVILWSLGRFPGEADGVRLRRLLELPRRLEFGSLGFSSFACVVYTAVACIWFDKSLTLVFPVLLVVSMLSMLIAIRPVVGAEQAYRSLVLDEFYRNPAMRPNGRGLLYPRHSWYLPYTYAITVLCLIIGACSVIWIKGRHALNVWAADLSARNQGAMVPELRARAGALVGDVTIPLAVIGVFVLVVATLTALALARQQATGARAVQNVIEGLAAGATEPPRWLSTTELGDLAMATATAFARLQSIARGLRESADALSRSAGQLGDSSQQQNESLAVQAEALQQTQETVKLIKESSLQASDRARFMLQLTERADEIRHSGQEAIGKSLNALTDIREQVAQMAGGMKGLEERARQIETITATVKDLADQSNVLALNAAIEAARSGEAGKGFAVVAREIRSLADQSIHATNRVRQILQDVEAAIRTNVLLTKTGSEKVEASLVQVRSSGENIRELSGIVQENAASIREIAAAVGQQDAGVAQVFLAVSELATRMGETMRRLQINDQVTATVAAAANQVNIVVGEFAGAQAASEDQANGVNPLGSRPPSPPDHA